MQNKLTDVYKYYENYPYEITDRFVSDLEQPTQYVAYFFGRIRGSCKFVYLMDHNSFGTAIEAGANYDYMKKFVEATNFNFNAYRGSYYFSRALKSPDPIASFDVLKKLGVNMKEFTASSLDIQNEDENLAAYVRDLEAEQKIKVLVDELKKIYGNTLSEYKKNLIEKLETLL